MNIGRREFLAGAGAAIASSAMARPIRSILGARLGYNGGESLPYDSEVEYLESTGTQWINTGIFGSLQLEVKVYGAFLAGGDNPLFACDNGAWNNGAYSLWITRWTSNNVSVYFIGVPIGNFAFYETSMQGVKVNGREFPISEPSSYETLDTIPLFAWRRNNRIIIRSKVKIHSVSMSEGGVVLKDFLSVRFTNEYGETEGAMYDRVSGELFRNQGTGSFIIGPDIS